MTRYVVWNEPYSNDPLTNVECKMTFEDVVKAQKAREPRYTDDERAFDDFVVIHWGTVEEESDDSGF